MKLLSLVALLPVLSFAGAAEPATTAELERRLQEQERQIRQLELENSRLRSMLDRDAPATPEGDRGQSAPQQTAEPAVYSVREGDTLSRIARKHGTTPEKLAAMNKLKNAGLIRPGQKLRIPGDEPAQPAPEPLVAEEAAPAEGSHTVKSGETLYSIARLHGLSPDALLTANPGINPRSLQVGQKLSFTSTSTASAKTRQTTAADSGADRNPSGLVSNKPTVRSVSIDREITFGEFASNHRMTTAKLNALNGLNLDAKTVLAKGSELYVSAQP